MELVIYKKGEDHLQTIVVNGRCLYTAYKNNKRDYTVEEYLDILGPDYACIEYQEASRMIDEIETKKYLKPWEEITEEKWFYWLEVLPPEKWQNVNGVEFFRVMEYMSGNITRHCARFSVSGGGWRFFSTFRRASQTYQELSEEIYKLIDKK